MEIFFFLLWIEWYGKTENIVPGEYYQHASYRGPVALSSGSGLAVSYTCCKAQQKDGVAHLEHMKTVKTQNLKSDA